MAKALEFSEQIYVLWDDEDDPKFATLLCFRDAKELQSFTADDFTGEGRKVAIYKLVEQGTMKTEVKIAIEIDDPKKARAKKDVV